MTKTMKLVGIALVAIATLNTIDAMYLHDRVLGPGGEYETHLRSDCYDYTSHCRFCKIFALNNNNPITEEDLLGHFKRVSHRKPCPSGCHICDLYKKHKQIWYKAGKYKHRLCMNGILCK